MFRRLSQVLAIIGLLGTSAIWIWSYYPTELGCTTGRRASIRVLLSDGVAVIHLSYVNSPFAGAGRPRIVLRKYVDTYPYRLRPIVASFGVTNDSGRGGQTRAIRIEIVLGFVFVIFGVVPFSFLVLLPFLKARKGRSTMPECSLPTPSSTRSGLKPPD